MLAALRQASRAKRVFSSVTRILEQASSLDGLAGRAKKRLDERRSAARQKATGSVLISPGREGRLLDWSTGGFAVESSLPVRVGALYHPRWRLGGALRIMAAVVRWSRLSRTVPRADGDVAPVFRSGFELVELARSASSPQTGVSWPTSESPISTPSGKYSFQRRVTRSEISSEQKSSSGKPGRTRASMTIGIR